MENLRITEADDYLQDSGSLISEKEIQDFEEEKDLESKRYASAEVVLKEVTKLFNNEKEKLITSLTFHALSNIYKYSGNPTINNRDATDFVSTSIEKILNCVRKWDRQKNPDIKSLFYLAVLSEVRNEAKSLESFNNALYSIEDDTNPKNIEDHGKKKDKKKRSRKLHFVPLTKSNQSGEEFENSVADLQVYKNYLYVEDPFDKSAEGIGKYFDKIFEELEETGDWDGALVLNERLKTKSNQIIAQNLGMELPQVEAALKRIKRLAYKRREKIDGE
jgi:hypothetical protein